MLTIGGKKFQSRLLLGTAQYPSPQILLDAINTANIEIITVAIRRQNLQTHNKFWELIQSTNTDLLPNTAGCFSAKEAVTTAQMAREIFQTNWIKLEVIADDYTLLPNGYELVKAAEELLKRGFFVLPYCTDDIVVCRELVGLGCEVLMPLAAPIGSGKGILNPYGLQLLRERFPTTTLIVDAGIGKPSHAILGMELGMDAVLLNTAVAQSPNPVQMARAFALAVQSGRDAYEAGMMPSRDMAHASTPLIGKPFWK